MTEGKKRNNGRNWTVPIENYQKLQISGNIRSEHHQVEIKVKVKVKKKTSEQEYFLEQNSAVETSPKKINIQAVPLIMYSGLFLKWSREELR